MPAEAVAKERARTAAARGREHQIANDAAGRGRQKQHAEAEEETTDERHQSAGDRREHRRHEERHDVVTPLRGVEGFLLLHEITSPRFRTATSKKLRLRTAQV